ncbi:hypothetical protein NM688_g2214 [Phlebia brevispora]|uniref:Uncharacterized protein n=1 Tax=Phlebia brevispora TaxID=194682 RepID=A0ACC1T9F9_9APHY|nr:hypothetical protein NM688_g2214 [Phlebia brevispora]
MAQTPDIHFMGDGHDPCCLDNAPRLLLRRHQFLKLGSIAVVHVEPQRCYRDDDLSRSSHPLHLCIQDIPSQREEGMAGSNDYFTHALRFWRKYLFLGEKVHVRHKSWPGLPKSGYDSDMFTSLVELERPAISRLMFMIFVGIVAVEVIITTSLCIVLWRLRTGIIRTDGIIRTIAAYSINAGVLTGLCAVMILVTYATMPGNYICIAFYVVVPGSSLNSLLAALNAREGLRNDSRRWSAIRIPHSDGNNPFSAVARTIARRTSGQSGWLYSGSAKRDNSPDLAAMSMNPKNTVEALFFGNAISTLLYGTASVQAYLYFNRCKDAAWFRALIIFLWIGETVHLCLTTYTIYLYTVVGLENPTQSTSWSLAAIEAVSTIDGTIIQVIYTYRLWLVSQKKIWLIVLIVRCLDASLNLQPQPISLIQMVPVVYSCCTSFFLLAESTTFGPTNALQTYKWFMRSAIVGVVLADMLIAISLCIVLWQLRTGVERTNGVIRTLIAYSISAGVLTSLCALGILITASNVHAQDLPAAMVDTCPVCDDAEQPHILGILSPYFNSLLASLNARKRLRHDNNWDRGIDIPLSNLSSIRFAAVKTRAERSTVGQPIEIQVDTHTKRKADSISGLPQTRLVGQSSRSSFSLAEDVSDVA